jgi:Tol biopolymer transport system component
VFDLSTTPGTVREVTPIDQRATYPDWGGAGSIVFGRALDAGMPDGPSDLYVVDPTGGVARRITTLGDAGRQAIQPTWVPGGDRVIFVEQDAAWLNVRMSTIDGDGGDPRSATGEIDMFGTHPRLQPRP